MVPEKDEAATDLGPGSEMEGPTLSVIVDGAPRAYPIPPSGTLSIGRGTDNDVVIAHASVSRHHAVLRSGAGFTLEDLGSGNGTRLNGAKLPAGARTPLEADTVVEIGKVLVVLRGLTPARPSSSRDAARARSVEEWVRLCGTSEITVLLLGETGVGKGVVAERIHVASRRRAGPLLALNCGALAETLLEAELFGHEKGAFTGAVADRKGLLEAANGGTFFLDEVGELSPSMQAKLLRALEDREVLRVGGRRPVTIDVRFIAATNRDLGRMVAEGSFRRDLLYRLSGVTVRIPPLRNRPAEIPGLVRAMLAKLAPAPPPVLEHDAMVMLQAAPWTGNVRELRNVLERAVMLSGGGPLRSEHILFDESVEASPHGAASTLKEEIEGFERSRVAAALERAGGNQTRAAELLGVSRRTLVRWLAQMDLPRPRKG